MQQSKKSQGAAMTTMLVLASWLLLGVSPILILDALSHRNFRCVIFFAFIAILSAAICFLCLNELSGPNNYPYYLNIAAIAINLFIGLFAAWAMSTPKRKEKCLGRNKARK